MRQADLAARLHASAGMPAPGAHSRAGVPGQVGQAPGCSPLRQLCQAQGTALGHAAEEEQLNQP